MKEKNEYNIIIADSHPIVVEGLTSLFSKSSLYTMEGICQNGKELRQLMESTKANTIIVDLKLPKTNIYRLIKDLIVLHSNVKIVAFTNYTMPKLVQDIMEFGVHGYVSKNASTQELLESIERVHNGEHFISPSVYNKGIKSEFTNEDFQFTPEENFSKFAELTERELDVIILLSRGQTNKEIAESLILSKYTVETHRKNIMKKFKFKTVGQLIYFATQQGLV